jgi:chromatin segregation and condensation protein Rec8/ScpA/Scc1 (kleisin family)
MSNHNKKRNVGLIYEQLIRYASKCILEGKQEKAEIAMQILKEHFKVGTELYKEFRLFNALVQTTVPTESFAFRVLSEEKDASRKHDTAKLDYEKGALIRSINKRLDFRDIVTNSENKVHFVYNFLALLEMIQQDLISIQAGIGFNNFWIEAKIGSINS